LAAPETTIVAGENEVGIGRVDPDIVEIKLGRKPLKISGQ
jgi:hypothetical protein